MKILIETIPHSEQRYRTVGDYFLGDDQTIKVKVSQEVGEDYAFLVAIHELIELKLCEKRGITYEAIDWFDKGYEAARKIIKPDDTSEPGDSSESPYSKEHAFATKIERMLSDQLNIDWSAYEAEVNKLP